MENLSAASSSSRINHLAREKDERRMHERKRNLHYLIAEFLRENRYSETLSTFCQEAKLSAEVQVCDNIDLESILVEYYDYFFTKFNRFPKMCKKIDSNSDSGQISTSKKEKNFKAPVRPLRKSSEDSTAEKFKSKNEISAQPHFDMSIKSLFPMVENCDNKYLDPYIHDRNLKSTSKLYPAGSELLEIAEIISKEILLTDLNVHWDDVKGLDFCKNVLKEAAIYPIKYPFMFSQKLTPWKGVLLYGPPGTGKTMLAKAVATECQATFFNITSSSLISKWRGESEKYIRVLLDLAKFHAPSIIFVDEVDWTVGGSDDCANKSEPSRRFRAELLARLDGLLTSEIGNVLLLTATNIPWELDTALLRRLEKRIYVDLPDEHARDEILKIFLTEELTKTLDYSQLVKSTRGFSCADLRLLCKEAWMMQLRPLWKQLESGNEIKMDPGAKGITKLSYLWEALRSVKPISKNLRLKYEKWEKSFTPADVIDEER